MNNLDRNGGAGLVEAGDLQTCDTSRYLSLSFGRLRPFKLRQCGRAENHANHATEMRKVLSPVLKYPFRLGLAMVEKIVRFLITVAVSLTPIAFNALRMLTRGQPLTLEALCGRGEILLVAAAISASAIGELFASGADKRLRKLLAGGSTIIILLLTSFWFADISGAALSGEEIDLQMITMGSVIMLVLSAIGGASCVALSEASTRG